MTNLPGGGAESQTATISCPFCDEAISANAKKCRHCSETIDVTMRKAEEAMRVSQNSTPQVFMNAGGGAASGNGQMQLRPWSHGLHIILTILTLGFWIPVWIILYLARNKSVYF
jgi:hypothetical protein